MRYLPLALAGGAFIVALVSLYLGSVKRADIRMIALPGLPVFLPNQERRDEGPPVRADVAVRVAVINSGARPGAWQRLRAEPSEGSPATDQETARRSTRRSRKRSPDRDRMPRWRDKCLGRDPRCRSRSHRRR